MLDRGRGTFASKAEKLEAQHHGCCEVGRGGGHVPPLHLNTVEYRGQEDLEEAELAKYVDLAL